MKISYNTLKNYINIKQTPQEIAQILTSTGLEVEGIETFNSFDGNLDGLYTAKVLTKTKHPNADSLSITTVDYGQGEPVTVVCGAPNVEANQKVILATIGSTVTINDQEVKIKKSKIRGQLSQGMICAEDEINMGKSHDGIMVLPEDTPVGLTAEEYFNYPKDEIINIDLTPNRGDGASHIGVARDIYAHLKFQNQDITLTKPSVKNFEIDNTDRTIKVEIKNSNACKRYTGITISGVKIAPSPEWLQNFLRAIGLTPINNIVDITNFVLHETGQPLHAFDADKISGNSIIVNTLPKDTPFTTLDDIERKLTDSDLMICDANETPMCMAGVLGGIESGVSQDTQNIFLESAYFDPVYIRKTAKYHAIQTDASYRFERSVDPEMIVYALKRAAMLIKEIAGGKITSEIQDVYPEKFTPKTILLKYAYVNKLIGIEIPKEDIKKILQYLDFKVDEFIDNELVVEAPLYRRDVTKPADVVEEILRIYGYNNIPTAANVNAKPALAPKPNIHKMQNLVSEMLTARGFSEAMSNSLSKEEYYEKISAFQAEKSVKLLNPLSQDLNVMRQSLLFGMAEATNLNINHKNTDIKLYEFGNVYQYNEGKPELDAYTQNHKLAIMISGNKNQENWKDKQQKFTFFDLKAEISNLLRYIHNNPSQIETNETENKIFDYGLDWVDNKKTIISAGLVSQEILNYFDIEAEMFFAEINWEDIIKRYSETIKFKPLAKYPAINRHLSLLIDKDVKFDDIKKIATKSAKSYLEKIDLLDIFNDENKIGKNKKSYNISFTFRDNEKTLKDKQVNKIMNKIIAECESKLSAQIR